MLQRCPEAPAILASCAPNLLQSWAKVSLPTRNASRLAFRSPPPSSRAADHGRSTSERCDPAVETQELEAFRWLKRFLAPRDQGPCTAKSCPALETPQIGRSSRLDDGVVIIAWNQHESTYFEYRSSPIVITAALYCETLTLTIIRLYKIILRLYTKTIMIRL